MIDPLAEPTRLVVVASGFGLWREGRHELSARWADVARVECRSDPPSLVVALMDARELRVDATIAGWTEFLAAAPGALFGTRTRPVWLPLPVSADGGAIVLYERRAPRQRSLQ